MGVSINTKDVIEIRTAHYFPIQLITLGAGLILGTVLLLFQENYLLAPVFLLFGTIFLTTNHHLQIDLSANTFREYIWFLGFKIGKNKPFPTPSNIVINPANQEVTFGDLDFNRMHSNQRKAIGYLKFEYHESIYLGEADNSQELLKRLEPTIRTLGIPVNNNAN
ncbi:MAG: hypothetical protein R8G66_22900 [Cytophagales bacterium]|nr:hypothetical protein [Cytophagales bacterium]